MTTFLALSSAVRTDPGRKRDINQDAGGKFEPGDAAIRAERGCLYVVTDGVGGHAAGEVAAGYAVEKVLHSYYALPWQGAQATLAAALQEANADIHAEGQREPTRRGMGCTVVAVAIVGDQAVVAHAGDSRAYLWRGGVLQPLTRDHSWVAARIAAGEITPDQARTHPNRNAILRNLGGKEEVHPDVAALTLQPGDRLLLCTDGLWGPVPDAELAGLVAAGDPEQAAVALIAAANLAGGPDNIGVVLIAVEGTVPAPVAATSGIPVLETVLPDTPAAVPETGDRGVASGTEFAPVTVPASQPPAGPPGGSSVQMAAPGRRPWGRFLPLAAGIGAIVLFLAGGVVLAGRRLGPDRVAADVAGVASVTTTTGAAGGAAARVAVPAATPKPEETACAGGETRSGFAPYCVKEGEPYSLLYDRCAVDAALPETYRRALVQPDNSRLAADPAALHSGLVWLPAGMTKSVCGGSGDLAGLPASATAQVGARTATTVASVAAAPRAPAVQPTVRAAAPQPAPVQPAPVFVAPAAPVAPAPVRTTAPEPEPSPVPTERPAPTPAPTLPPTAVRTSIPERTIVPTAPPTALPTLSPSLPPVSPTALPTLSPSLPPTATPAPAPPPPTRPPAPPTAEPTPTQPTDPSGGRDNQG